MRLRIAGQRTALLRKLPHIREPLHCLREAFDGFVGVPVLDAVSYAMADVALQDDLPCFVEGRLRRVDLGKHVLAGDVLVHHAVDSLDLADDFL